jgi:ferredoxin
MTVLIDASMCSGCGECVEVCVVEAIHLENAGPVVDDELCVACGACEAACPTGAIQLSEVTEQP